MDTHCSTGGYVFLMYRAAISWSSRLQTSPALFSVEVKYMAMMYVAQEVIWICQLLEDLNYKQTSLTTLLDDN